MHFTETCETDEPHLIVEVTTTVATTPDGEVLDELHASVAEHEVLPRQHLVDMGYVEASVLAESQTHYQVDLVGPVPPDVSWQAKDAERFDHSRFAIDWETQHVCCPAGEVRKTGGMTYDRHGKAAVRVRFPLATCRACPLHAQCTQSPARVLILRPNEAGLPSSPRSSPTPASL